MLLTRVLVQTFLSHADFEVSASHLDGQRLGKQRVETLQIMQVLTHHRLIARGPDGAELPRDRWNFKAVRPGSGWAHHPAILMWQRHELALLLYQTAICNEWISRGYRDTCLVKTSLLYHGNAQHISGTPLYPEWLGNPDFHISHQSNLIRKDPKHYGPLFPGVPDDLPYLWPTSI